MLSVFLATNLRVVPSSKVDKKALTDSDAPLVAMACGHEPLSSGH
jgi:hypothetical protein